MPNKESVEITYIESDRQQLPDIFTDIDDVSFDSDELTLEWYDKDETLTRRVIIPRNIIQKIDHKFPN